MHAIEKHAMPSRHPAAALLGQLELAPSGGPDDSVAAIEQGISEASKQRITPRRSREGGSRLSSPLRLEIPRTSCHLYQTPDLGWAGRSCPLILARCPPTMAEPKGRCGFGAGSESFGGDPQVKSWQRRAGTFLLMLSGLVIQQSIFVLRVFDAGQPGSGFMPLGLGIILAVLSCLLILTHLGADETKPAFWKGSAWLRPSVAVAIFAAYIIAFEWLGAALSVVVLVVAWLLILERKPALAAVSTGILTGIVVYFLFAVALQAPLPRGVLFGG